MAAGCAAPPAHESPSPQPGAGSPSTEQLSSQEAEALAALENHEQDTYYLFTAEGEILKKCLDARGITAYPTTLVTDPLRDIAGKSGTPEAFALWYAAGKVPNSTVMTPTSVFAPYGYSGVQQANPIDTAYYNLSSEEQDLVQIAIDGKNGNLEQVAPPEESCRGEVNDILFSSPDGVEAVHSEESIAIVAELIDGIPSAQAQSEIKKDPALQAASQTWAQCMLNKGIAVSNAPSAAPQAPPAVDAATAESELESEVAMATAGAECDADAQLNTIYQTAVKNWRISKLKVHPDAVLEYFEIRAPFIAAAKAYLGIK